MTMQTHFQQIAQALSIRLLQVERSAQLLDEGATIPFISRYRKEITGGLDEVQLTAVRDQLMALRELDKRKEVILKTLADSGTLTSELEKALRAANTLGHLEDLYLPFRPKRKTRASVAREKGLEPLAQQLFRQEKDSPAMIARAFLNAELGVNTVEDALAGARDILAERMSEDTEARTRMRRYFEQKARYRSSVSKGKEQEGIKYKDYFEWEEAAKSAPSHRVLAMRRGEEEGFLKVEVLPPDAEALELLEKQFIKAENAAAGQVRQALEDSYKRLLRPAMETEYRTLSKQKADEEAIKVFAGNARQLLMAAPLGQKQVLAIDPGFRTGCKVVCLDRQGNLLENTTIFPHQGAASLKDAAWKLTQLCEKYEVEAIAIGNGTAGRETETFVRNQHLAGITVVMVNESGASIYSASAVAREEFPDHDVTVRGAVSIGRRLMDPLAELVKIDPKSIGVGQYQHDVDQRKLQQSLDDTVMSCVNAVGVELNTASRQILAYVSGLGERLAANIIQYRQENGPFKSRESLRKVPRLGDKAFEQAAGFLRIRHAKEVLDASGVHPERYALVRRMATDLGCQVKQLMEDASLRQRIQLNAYISEEVGLPTLQDILKELAKPGRDPREQFEAFAFADGVNRIEDLREGMTLKGIVTNITNFGAFVDIGVHQDGLVHTSQMAYQYVANPADVVKVGQVVEVRVVETDIARKRISLTMKVNPEPARQNKKTRDKAPYANERNDSRNSVTDVKGGGEQEFKEKLARLKGMFKS